MPAPTANAIQLAFPFRIACAIAHSSRNGPSLYFSTVTFTTVGYGDIVLDREWRQLASFEAVNGWIIFGWATALIMAVIQRLYFTK